MKEYNKPYVKTVSFYPHKSDDMKLHEKLKRLDHGEFNRVTKEMWEKRLKEEKR